MTKDLVALLWGEQEQPARGPKPGLDPRGIAEAAVAIADAEGLDAVSMNKVAVGFGVSGMALYRYVPGKAELVGLMVEAVAGRPDLSTAGPGWRAQLTAWARGMLGLYRAHPWVLSAIAMRRQVMGPRQLAWLDAALAALEPTGLSATQRHHVFILIAAHVRGVAQQYIDFDRESDEDWTRLSADLLTRHATRFPALTRAIAEGGFTQADEDSLDFGLTRILDGVQVLIDQTVS